MSKIIKITLPIVIIAIIVLLGYFYSKQIVDWFLEIIEEVKGMVM